MGTGGGHFRRPWSKQLKSFTIQEISFTHVDRVEKTTIFRDRAVMLYDATVRHRNNWSPLIIILIIFFSFLIIVVDIFKVSVKISFVSLSSVYNSEIKIENVLDISFIKKLKNLQFPFSFLFFLLRSNENYCAVLSCANAFLAPE